MVGAFKEEEAVYPYLPKCLYERNYTDAEEVIARVDEECFVPGKAILLAVCLQEEKTPLVGIAEIYHYEPGETKASIGCRLRENVWGQGIATQLLRLAAAVAAEAGAHTLKLSYILAGPELTAMDRVARKMGGDPAYVRPVYTMDSAQFRDSALLGRAFTAKYRPPESVVPFTDLTREQIEALYADPEVPWYVHPRNRTRMRPELSLAFVQDGRVAGFWLGSVSTPGNYSVQGVWRSPAAPVTTFHVLVAAHLNLCFYHGGGDFRYHCSPAVAFADELIQRYSEGKCRRLEEHAASIPLPYNE